jgi:predicted  nucleic acid-binding Zn-ribbon protein
MAGAISLPAAGTQTSNDILNAEDEIDSINNYLTTANKEIMTKKADIDKKANQISEKQKQVYGQSQEIEDKIKLLDTRNKMLQLSIDQNVYKKKVIYSLLSVIIALIVGMIFFYTFFSKKMTL